MLKTGVRVVAGLLATVVATINPASATPDIVTQTIPFNVYAQDAYPSISADGRYLAYKLEQKGGSYPRNIYVQDLVTGQRINANISLTGTVASNAGCDVPSISANGRYVVFGCQYASLMGGVTKGGAGYFVYDRETNTTQMIPDTGDDRPNSSHGAGISADGRYVAFRTQTVSGVYKIYVRDMVSKTTSATAAQFVTAPAGMPRLSISADGRYIAYTGKASASATVVNASVYDRVTGLTEAVDVRPNGSRTTSNVQEVTMSADGSAVVFSSTDSSLATTTTTSGLYGTFLRDRTTGKTELVSGFSTVHSTYGAVSGNARYVSYVLGNVMYAYDRLTKISRRIVLSSLNAYGAPRLSADGRYVVFTTSNPGGNLQSVTVADMGAPAGVNLSASTLALTEGGNAGTYSMVLNQVPDANVKITVNAGSQLSLARSELTFTPANWSVPQLVSVQAIADGVVEGTHNATITHAVGSTDVNYTVVQAADVKVAISDSVTPTITLPATTWDRADFPITGTAAPGATVLVTSVNRSTGWLSSVSTVADAQGNWSYTLTGYTDGVIDIDAQADGIKSATQTVTVLLATAQ